MCRLERLDISRRSAEAKAIVMVYKAIGMLLGHHVLQQSFTRATTITQSSTLHAIRPIRLDTKRRIIANTAMGRHIEQAQATSALLVLWYELVDTVLAAGKGYR